MNASFMDVDLITSEAQSQYITSRIKIRTINHSADLITVDGTKIATDLFNVAHFVKFIYSYIRRFALYNFSRG